MSSPAKLNLEIYIGDTFQKLLQFFEADGVTPIDITGYSFKMQIRKCKDSPDVIAELNSPTEIELTDPTSGKITLKLNSATTSTLEEQNAVYGLNWTDLSPAIRTLVEGNIRIIETITKN